MQGTRVLAAEREEEVTEELGGAGSCAGGWWLRADQCLSGQSVHSPPSLSSLPGTEAGKHLAHPHRVP